MFERLRKRRHDHLMAKQRTEFEKAVADSDKDAAGHDLRARDLPDPLGDFNEMTRMGPTVGGVGGGGSGV